MAIPEGYEKLAVIGITYKNEYVEGTAYKLLNAVYHEGATYVALKDNPVGPPVADNVNWQYMAKGFTEGVMSAINAVDTSALLGTAGETVGAQNLIDAIAAKVLQKLDSSRLVDNLLTTEAGFALDARMGKTLKDQLDQVNSDLKTDFLCTSTNATSQGELFTLPDLPSYSGFLMAMDASATSTIASAIVPAALFSAGKSFDATMYDSAALFRCRATRSSETTARLRIMSTVASQNCTIKFFGVK